MRSLALGWRTALQLRPTQVAHRLRRLAQRTPSVCPPEGTAGIRERRCSPAARVTDCGYDGRGFRFLNVFVRTEDADRWRPEVASRLWAYNLHYFEYLWGLPAASGANLVEDWMASNQAGSSPGWEPYPISRRVREWIEWVLANPDLPTGIRGRIASSVRVQVEWLEAGIEYDLEANHLLENAITLCWAGLSMTGLDAERWVSLGRALLSRCLGEQVLGDGSHEERSPMYQALLTQELLRLREVAATATGRSAREIEQLTGRAGQRMLASLGSFVHPDGEYALVNDCAFGIAPTFSELIARFGSPSGNGTKGVWSLADAGYHGFGTDDGTYLIFDAGDIGPDCQPGHGHADALSFELSLGGRRLLTDSGVFGYEMGPVRLHDRSTAAHNTVTVNDRNQSEVWAAFRCGRRHRILNAGARKTRNGAECSGSCEYEIAMWCLVRHFRGVEVSSAGALSIVDVIEADGRHTATARFHVDPEVTAEPSGRGVLLSRRGHREAFVSCDDGDIQVGESPYHPEFGLEKVRPCLSVSSGFRDRLTLRTSIVPAGA